MKVLAIILFQLILWSSFGTKGCTLTSCIFLFYKYDPFGSMHCCAAQNFNVK